MDCGLSFPDEDMPGVDSVIPDFTFVEKNWDRKMCIRDRPAALAISNLFDPHYTRSRREAACRGHTKSHSVHPIYYKSEAKDDETVFFLSMAHHR